MQYQIRMATRDDVPGMLAIYAPIIEETTISFEYHVPSEPIFWQRVSKVLAESAWLVCVQGDTVVGYAYASAHRGRTAYQWNREMSVYVHADHRGRSIATSLYHALFGIIRRQGYTNALIGITLPNKPSEAFHEKLGFEKVGIYRDVGFKHGAYHSVGWWQMKLTGDIPQELRGIKEFDVEEWEGAINEGMSFLKKA